MSLLRQVMLASRHIQILAGLFNPIQGGDPLQCLLGNRTAVLDSKRDTGLMNADFKREPDRAQGRAGGVFLIDNHGDKAIYWP